MTDFLLEPPVDPVPTVAASAPASPGRQTLGGIDWAGVAAEGRGEIALVEVEPGAGELQTWARRGDA